MAEKAKQPIKTTDEEKSKSKFMGGCLIVLLVLFLTPLIAVGALYAFNREFKLNVNSVMSGMPGGVGEYFERFPTKAEEREQVRTVSEYIMSLPVERAVDKMLVLRSEDARAYDEVVKDMLRINPNKTRTILEEIRGATVSRNVLLNTVQRIEEETQQEIVDLSNAISRMSLDFAVDEIMRIIEGSINGHQEAALVLEQMSTNQAMTIMYQLDVVDRNRIFSNMLESSANAIRNAHSALMRKQDDLRQIASSYRTENANMLVNTIGNTDTYSMDDLAIIYKNLGAKKAGEVLSKVDNETFIFDLIGKIKANEILENNTDVLTPDILKALKIYKEFDDNIRELVNVYSRMPNNRVVEVIRSMMINASPSTVYDLDNGDLIMISDEDVVIAILRSFPDAKVGDILTLLDQTLSTELTRQLALPRNQ